MKFVLRKAFALALLGVACAAAGVMAEPIRPLKTVQQWAQYTDRIVVRLKDEPASDRRQPMGAERARTLSAAAGTYLIPYRLTGDQAHVMRLTHAMPLAAVERIAAKLAQDPNVLYAEPDRRKYPHATPSDPRFNLQWNLFEAAGGVNAQTAWDLTTGSSSVVVAIVDTGLIFSNPDIAGRTLPGYDFIGSDDGNIANRSGGDFGTQFFTANDGNGRDTDPSDFGDWISPADKMGFFTAPACTVSDSSWHGTSVTGIFGAAANNGFGIAGVDWNAGILPVRVLGKCGGYDSDILDGARWAAGITVIGAGNVPVTNPNPAQVINLSLGGPVTNGCPAMEQNAINEILATGRVKAIVTSAGNENQDASQNSPGDCNGVINVAATDRAGSRASYSDFGAAITISAPGGFIIPNDPTDTGMNGIIDTSNCGTTGPITVAANCPTVADRTRAGSPYIAFFESGTSFSAPQVSGTVSLMLAVNPTLNAANVLNVLTSTARAFPAGSTCNKTNCGAGIVDANAAVRLAASLPGGVNFTPAPPPPSGGGGGGGGGCTTGSGTLDFALPLLMLMALLGLARRKQE